MILHSDCSYYSFYPPSFLPTIPRDISEVAIGQGDLPKACTTVTAPRWWSDGDAEVTLGE